MTAFCANLGLKIESGTAFQRVRLKMHHAQFHMLSTPLGPLYKVNFVSISCLYP
jgi:hypothetical protein